MALSINVTNRTKALNRNIVDAIGTFDDAYATGGVGIDASTLGLSTIESVQLTSGGPIIVAYDAGKVLAYIADSTDGFVESGAGDVEDEIVYIRAIGY